MRPAVERNDLRVLDWKTSQLGGGAGNPVSVGLYRFEGSAQAPAERVAWSVVLKVIHAPAQVELGGGDDQSQRFA